MQAKKTTNERALNTSDSSNLAASSATQAALQASAVITPSSSAPASNFVSAELLVQFNDGVGAAGRAKALAAISGNVVEVVWSESAHDNAAKLLRVKISANLPTEKAIQILSQQAGVKFAEQNYIVSTQATSNDPSYTKDSTTLWGMHGDQTGSLFGTGADEVWAAGYTGDKSTVVGIIDSGIDYRHPDLYLNIWLNQNEISSTLKTSLVDSDSDGLITFRDLNSSQNASYVSDLNNNGYIDAGDLLNDIRWENGVDEDGNGYRDDLVGWDFVNNDNDPLDDNNHGTHVGGTIGGIGGNGTGVVGVNWETQMMGLKFLGSTGSGAISNAIRALDYYTNISNQATAASNFVGTNNSWGGGGYTQGMLDAIIRTAQSGNLFVAAAGNSTSNNDAVASYPSNYSTQSALGWDAVVAVASITSSGVLSSFSSYGNTTVDLAAPGSNIMSTLPNGTYGAFNGTSMATPHVAGALALIASAMPNATAQECLAILQQCVTYKADLAGSLAWDGYLDIGKLLGLLPSNSLNPNVSAIEFSDIALKSGDVSNIKITFSEAVTGFDISDIGIANNLGSLSGFNTADNKVFNVQFTPATNTEAKNVALTILDDSYTSADGSRSGNGKISAPFNIDTKAPTASISMSDLNLTSGETATVSFSFSEAVVGFTVTDVTVSNGNLSAFAAVNSNNWTAIFTPTKGIVVNTNAIQLNANSYTDSAGNFGGAAISANYTVDTSINLVVGTDASNTLVGTAGKDILNGVPANSTLFGRGSKDTMTGQGGADIFVLGTQGKVFYNDGRANNLGTSDYADIRDFATGVDKLQLAQNKYLFNSATVNKVTGTGVYWDINANNRVDSADEMIGFLAGVTNFNSAGDVIFV